MFKKLVSSLWNSKASIINKKKLNYFQPNILNLEDRITPAQTVSLTLNAGVLEIKSNTSSGETNNFTVTQDSPTSNFIRFTGAGGTVFTGNAALFTSGFNTSLAEVNSLNLTAFNKDKKAFAIAKVGKQEKKEKTPISLKHIEVFFKNIRFRLKCCVHKQAAIKQWVDGNIRINCCQGAVKDVDLRATTRACCCCKSFLSQ